MAKTDPHSESLESGRRGVAEEVLGELKAYTSAT